MMKSLDTKELRNLSAALLERIPWVVARMISCAPDFLRVSAAVMRVPPVSIISSMMMHFLPSTPAIFVGRLILRES